MNKVIGLDVGTTHIKSILFDEEGSILKEEKCKTPLVVKEEGSVYCPDEIIKIVECQLEELQRLCPETPIGISITGMAEAGLIVDSVSGEPMSEILPWFDKRTSALAQKMSHQEEERVFSTTGLRNSYKYGIYKYLWLLNEKGIEKQSTMWLSICDYIAFKLTGEFVTDPTFGARTFVYNVLEGKWDKERIEAYGLVLSNFPKVVPSGEMFGYYKGIPVAIAGHDHICAAFGLLYNNCEGICDSAGTSETYVGILNDCDENKKTGFLKESGLLYGPYVNGGYFYMANIPSSGHSVEWFRKNLQMEEMDYIEMNEKLNKLSKNPTEILYFPYLTGMGAPLYEADRTGAIIGIRESHKGMEVLKGILEGIQYQAKWVLSIVEQYHSNRCNALYCAGGGVYNETMMQIKADILNHEVMVPAVSEATLSGAVALYLHKNTGGKAAEMFLKNPLTIQKKYQPDSSNAEAYGEIFRERYFPLTELIN